MAGSGTNHELLATNPLAHRAEESYTPTAWTLPALPDRRTAHLAGPAGLAEDPVLVPPPDRLRRLGLHKRQHLIGHGLAPVAEGAL